MVAEEHPSSNSGRRNPTSSTSGSGWSREELAAAVSVYAEMLASERAGRHYQKSRFREDALREALKGRSAAAFERRMGNISLSCR